MKTHYEITLALDDICGLLSNCYTSKRLKTESITSTICGVQQLKARLSQFVCCYDKLYDYLEDYRTRLKAGKLSLNGVMTNPNDFSCEIGSLSLDMSELGF